jgi:hypothetical protein
VPIWSNRLFALPGNRSIDAFWQWHSKKGRPKFTTGLPYWEITWLIRCVTVGGGQHTVSDSGPHQGGIGSPPRTGPHLRPAGREREPQPRLCPANPGQGGIGGNVRGQVRRLLAGPRGREYSRCKPSANAPPQTFVSSCANHTQIRLKTRGNSVDTVKTQIKSLAGRMPVEIRLSCVENHMP